jgi:hypothetical protein
MITPILLMLAEGHDVANEVARLFFCGIALLANLYLIYVTWRKSPLGTIASVALLQILLGTAIVPIGIQLGFYSSGFHGNQYLLTNLEPGIAPVLHLFCFTIGSVFGWHVGVRSRFSGRVITILSRPLYKVNAFYCALFLLVVSLLSYGLLFALIDWDLLLTNARGSTGAAYGEQQKYLFLKSFASLGMWSVCFLPSLSKVAGRSKMSLIVAMILVYVILTFAIAISRNLLLWTILVPAIVLLRYSALRLYFKFVATAVVVIFASIVLLYGKSYSQVQRKFISDGEMSAPEKYDSDNLITATISNLEFQWYSIDAGICNFVSGNPPPLAELALSITVGYVPSRVLESVSLSGLSYTSYGDSGIAAVNSRFFSLDDGTVPPGIIGFSAYLGPWVMGFLVGFLFLYSLSTVLQFSFVSTSRQASWICWFWLLLLTNWFSFIPMACALASFGALVIFGYSLALRVSLK